MATLELELSAEPRAPQAAREAIRAEFADVVGAPTLYDLLTVVTELVANSVAHSGSETIGLEVEVGADGRVVGAVEDGGREAVVGLGEIDLAVGGGLGLHIVDALADSWTVTTGKRTVVRFELAPP